MKRLLILSILWALPLFGIPEGVRAFELSGSSWGGSQATIFTTGGDSNSTFDSAFIEALNQWNDLSNFRFINANGFADPCADPNIYGPPWFNGYSFRSDNCGASFGNSTLAVTHRWSSRSSGEIIQAGTVFNTAWSWDIHSGSGENIDFKRTAAHELGHSLGLDHEPVAPALMNAFYSQVIETPQDDDINGIQAIYGVGSSVAAFVTRFYQQCLSRNPDQAGLNGWVNALFNGTLAGADVAYGFIFSQEFINRNTSNAEYVTILYRAFFGREPDTAGYNGWVTHLNSGSSREQVLNGFIYSQEFFNLCVSYGITPYFDV